MADGVVLGRGPTHLLCEPFSGFQVALEQRPAPRGVAVPVGTGPEEDSIRSAQTQLHPSSTKLCGVDMAVEEVTPLRVRPGWSVRRETRGIVVDSQGQPNPPDS